MIERTWMRNWMIWYACLLHLSWGVILMFSAAPLHSTPLAYFPIHNRFLAGFFMVAIAIAAHAGLSNRVRFRRLAIALTFPQQFAMMVSALSAIVCVSRGAYADGVYRDPMFILADQLPSILAMLMHSFALLDWFVFSRESTGR